MRTESLNKILKPAGVLFDEVGHTYTAENGDLYTGCTTISEAWDKSFFLGPWHAKEMANFILSQPYDQVIKLSPPEFEKFILDAKGAARRVGDKAKNDGKAANEWVGGMISAKISGKGKKPIMPESKESQNAINAFIAWAKKQKIEWLASEEVVASHEQKVAGTLDAIAVIDGLTYLVDFKTSGQISASYLLQCAGYDVMLREMGMQVMGYLILRIPKDGKEAETLTITNADDMKFFRETFLKQREAHKFYSYMDAKFKNEIGKMKVDEKIAPVTVKPKKVVRKKVMRKK